MPTDHERKKKKPKNKFWSFSHLSSILVRERGLEPPRAKRSPAPQAGASTDSATRA